MSEEKQIKKMAEDICRVKHNCNDVCNPINTCNALKYARRAYEAGYRQQEWISVSERLPKEGVRVLVWLKGDNRQYTSIDTDRLSLKKWVRWGRLVTHWMELPEPPKGE